MSEQLTGQEKFDTCAHRSDEPEVSVLIKQCCGGSQEVTKSFLCWALSLDGVTPEVCGLCVHYRKDPSAN
jgi:hypothetical protein